MKDCKRREIGKEYILRNAEGNFCRVDYVGKDRITTASSRKTSAQAREIPYSGFSCNKLDINQNKLEIVETRPLGVYDSTGREYFTEDEVVYCGRKHKVFDAVKSRNNDEVGYILVERLTAPGGWDLLGSSDYTILPKEDTIKITIEVNGEKVDKPISVETAKRLGIVE